MPEPPNFRLPPTVAPPSEAEPAGSPSARDSSATDPQVTPGVAPPQPPGSGPLTIDSVPPGEKPHGDQALPPSAPPDATGAYDPRAFPVTLDPSDGPDPRNFPVTSDVPAAPAAPEVAAGFLSTIVPPQQPPTVRQRQPAVQTVVSGYEIMEELGRGAMGVVYKARQRGLNRLVALKMILAGVHAGPQELARFRGEGEAVARLQHPHIVQIYEVGEQDGRPYFSLEYVDGGSLATRLTGDPLQPYEAAQLIETLARAMQAAHEHGIVHRDLKPGNVLLTADGRPKITDFGLAKQIDADTGQTRTGAIMGTPSYMAPEQAAGQVREIGPATDVYALGAILYELLTGRPPFRAESWLETLEQVRNQEPIPPRQLARPPRDLETICLKCLHKVPGRRYASALALAEDLARFRDGEPITARPISPWERAAKWVRRRPLAASLAGLAAAVPVGLVALILWHNNVLRAELADALAVQERLITEQNQERAQADVRQLLEQARAALAAEDLATAGPRAEQALVRLKDVPGLAGLRAEAEELNRQITELRQVRQRYARFLRRWDDALFHETLAVTGSDLAANLRETSAAAEEALAQFDAAGTAASLALLSPEEQATVREGSFELLLVLAQTLATQPGPDRQPQLTAALALLDRAAGLRPDSPALHLWRARYLEQLGRAAEARAERDEAERLPPAGAADHYLLGSERYNSGQPARAVADFTQALRLKPDHFWAQFYLAVCQLQLGKPADARASLNVCKVRKPDFSGTYLLLGFTLAGLAEPDAAAAEFDQALRLQPDESARYAILVNRGVLRIQQGRFDDAVADLSQAIALKPQHYQAHVNVAQALLKLGRLDEALAEMTRALELEPKSPVLFRARARIHLLRQDNAAALRDLDAGIALHPPGSKAASLVDCHVERARLLHQQRQLDGALQSYEAALTLRPELPEVWRDLARLHLLHGRQADAMRAYDRYFEHGGTPLADVYRERGLARTKANDTRGAVDDYTHALNLERDATTLGYRGWAYLVLEAPRLALDDFDAAVELEPANADAHSGRGHARARLGRTVEAVEDAEASLRGPETARLLCNAARIYALVLARFDTPGNGAARPPAETRARYQDRAVQLLRQAVDSQPAGQRAEFWKTRVQADAALQPLYRSAVFGQLDALYGSRASP